MSRLDALIVATTIAGLFALAVFTNPPAWFNRGRHHHRHGRPTVAQLAHRLAREVELAKVGSGYIALDVDFAGFKPELRRALLGYFDTPEHFAPEQLGALSV